jgi:hypothetical protein
MMLLRRDNKDVRRQLPRERYIVFVGRTVQRSYTYRRDLISQKHWNGSAWTPSYHLADGLGSVRTLTDASGSATDNDTYDANKRVLNPELCY